jgi:hypothetical protein
MEMYFNLKLSGIIIRVFIIPDDDVRVVIVSCLLLAVGDERNWSSSSLGAGSTWSKLAFNDFLISVAILI